MFFSDSKSRVNIKELPGMFAKSTGDRHTLGALRNECIKWRYKMKSAGCTHS
jgi:hypothetical protein